MHPVTIVANSSNQIFIGEPHELKPNYIYKLDNSFNTVKSFCKTPDKFYRIKEVSMVLHGLDIDERGQVYTIHSLDYKIKVFDSSGKALHEFGKPGKIFREMKGLPPKGMDYNRWLKFSKKIDRPLNLYILESRFVIIQISRGGDNKHPHMIDIYTTDGKKIADDILLNKLPVGRDSRGNLYLLEEHISEKGLEVKFILHKYKMKPRFSRKMKQK